MKRRAALKTGLAFGAGVFILRRAEAQGATLNLYSARHYNTDEALYGNFADLSGVKINRIDAEPDPLVERLKAEGDKSPCDVFITTDAGRIERARQMGLLQPVSSEVLTKSVPAHLRDPDNSSWLLPTVTDPWEHHQPFSPTPETAQEPILSHYYTSVLGVSFETTGEGGVR